MLLATYLLNKRGIQQVIVIKVILVRAHVGSMRPPPFFFQRERERERTSSLSLLTCAV